MLDGDAHQLRQSAHPELGPRAYEATISEGHRQTSARKPTPEAAQEAAQKKIDENAKSAKWIET
jgi:hypothetical protein